MAKKTSHRLNMKNIQDCILPTKCGKPDSITNSPMTTLSNANSKSGMKTVGDNIYNTIASNLVKIKKDFANGKTVEEISYFLLMPGGIKPTDYELDNMRNNQKYAKILNEICRILGVEHKAKNPTVYDRVN